MGWLDRLMDRLTARGTKLVGSGHPPADTTPPTGSGELSEELQADYGHDSPAAEPPTAEEDRNPGEPRGSEPSGAAEEHR
jgi:hypothetical protein